MSEQKIDPFSKWQVSKTPEELLSQIDLPEEKKRTIIELLERSNIHPQTLKDLLALLDKSVTDFELQFKADGGNLGPDKDYYGTA